MVDYSEMRRKFPAKKTVLKRKSSKAAVKAIAREYEMKKARLTGGAPVFKKGFVFYTVVIIGLLMLGSMVLSVCGKGGHDRRRAAGAGTVRDSVPRHELDQRLGSVQAARHRRRSG